MKQDTKSEVKEFISWLFALYGFIALCQIIWRGITTGYWGI